MTIEERLERNKKYRKDIDELVRQHNELVTEKRKLNYEYAADVYPYEVGEKIFYIKADGYEGYNDEEIKNAIKEGVYGGIDSYYINFLSSMVRPIIKAIKKDGTASKNNIGIYDAIIRKTKEEVLEAVKELRAYNKKHNIRFY